MHKEAILYLVKGGKSLAKQTDVIHAGQTSAIIAQFASGSAVLNERGRIERSMLDETTLRRLYLEEQRSIRDIAALQHVPTRTVYDALIRYRIPRRPSSFRNPRAESAGAPLDEATLRRWYLEEARTIRAIAELARVSTRVIYDALIRYQIPRRTVGQRRLAVAQPLEATDVIDEATLRRLYEEEHQSIAMIAAALACSPSRVRSALVRWGIALRRRGRPGGAGSVVD